MPLPIPSIPWWAVVPSAGVGVAGLSAWMVWDWIPNKRKTPLFRGQDGRFYFIARGQNNFNPVRKNEVGNAAGLETDGPVIGGFLVYKGFQYRKQADTDDSDMIIAKGLDDRGVFNSGLYWIGLLGVVKIHTNKWEEFVEKEGKRELVTFVRREYGFSAQVTNMGGRTAPSEDKGNVPIEIDYEIYWRIECPDKAKREVDDANYKAIGLIDGEIVAWINSQAIYRFETDTTGKIVAASMDKEAIKAELIKHLQNSKVYARVRETYGYQITEFVVHDIVPLGEFAELLALGAKTDLQESAKLRKLQWQQTQAVIEVGIQEQWALLYRNNPEAVVRGIIVAAEKHGLPIVSNTVETLLRGAAKGGEVIPAEDIAKIAAMVMGMIDERNKKQIK